MGMSRWVWAALGCAACAASDVPPAPPPAPPAPTTWTLVGEVTLGAVHPRPRPGFEEAVDLLGPECATATARLGDRAPPCRAELWRPLRPAGEPVDDARAFLLQVGRSTLLLTASGEHQRSARWPDLGPVLERCLGDPLALPPTGDPQGYRHLVIEAESAAWVLHLSGANACQLSGSLRLGISPDQVSVEDLSVGAVPWRERGAQAALAMQRAAVRVEVRDRFAELSAAERIVGFETLVHDPDPEALTILEQLAATGGPGSRDAARAIERRARHEEGSP